MIIKYQPRSIIWLIFNSTRMLKIITVIHKSTDLNHLLCASALNIITPKYSVEKQKGSLARGFWYWLSMRKYWGLKCRSWYNIFHRVPLPPPGTNFILPFVVQRHKMSTKSAIERFILRIKYEKDEIESRQQCMWELNVFYCRQVRVPLWFLWIGCSKDGRTCVQLADDAWKGEEIWHLQIVISKLIHLRNS